MVTNVLNGYLMAGTWKSESVRVVYTWDLDTRWEIGSLNLDVTV